MKSYLIQKTILLLMTHPISSKLEKEQIVKSALDFVYLYRGNQINNLNQYIQMRIGKRIFCKNQNKDDILYYLEFIDYVSKINKTKKILDKTLKDNLEAVIKETNDLQLKVELDEIKTEEKEVLYNSMDMLIHEIGIITSSAIKNTNSEKHKMQIMEKHIEWKNKFMYVKERSGQAINQMINQIYNSKMNVVIKYGNHNIFPYIIDLFLAQFNIELENHVLFNLSHEELRNEMYSLVHDKHDRFFIYKSATHRRADGLSNKFKHPTRHILYCFSNFLNVDYKFVRSIFLQIYDASTGEADKYEMINFNEEFRKSGGYDFRYYSLFVEKFQP